MRIVILIVSVFIFIISELAYGAFATRLCKNSEDYICYKVKSRDSWKSLFPNDPERDYMMRLNRINIPLYRGLKIAIPKTKPSYFEMLDISPYPLHVDDVDKRTIFVSLNPKILAWGAYDASGNLMSWGPVSGGQDWCNDVDRACHSPIGKFKIYHKEGPYCVSTKFPVGKGGAPMPYCMYFYRGFALHGSYEVPGYNASHGCVRMFIPDAKWLNHTFSDGEEVDVVINR